MAKMDNNKKLLRPRNGRKISGVCLAVANYFGMYIAVAEIYWLPFVCFIRIYLKLLPFQVQPVSSF